MPVFNKMVYNGTEYILGGGGNIGEPLNFTVTTSGLDATITWEDNEIGTIPPTTFQKSELVRKIGSAPTSPSDGTLVVTETVKDTYKTTGYVDQGLTDGEIYYYRVFSYSDLGGISYCDAVSVTPSGGGWQPGANTIAYYPLNGDILDYSGNGYDMSTRIGTITYGTLTGGTQYGIFDGSTILSTTNIENVSTGTISAYVYYNGEGVVFVDNVNSTGNNNYISVFLITGGSYYYIFSPSATKPTVSTPSAGWNLLTLTQDGTTLNFYINGTLIDTFSSNLFLSSLSGNQWCIGGLARGTQYYDKLSGYISNIIIEDKVRTAQEISDYFNQTKADYGIS